MELKQSLEHSSLPLLSLLRDQDRYGCEMISELERQSDHTFQMKEGTLYPVLKKLEAGGCVTSYPVEANGRTRKYYRITQRGLVQLAQETAAWERYVHGIHSVLGTTPG